MLHVKRKSTISLWDGDVPSTCDYLHNQRHWRVMCVPKLHIELPLIAEDNGK